jgi:hypothetical protein
MSLGKHEPVSLRILRAAPLQNPPIQRGYDIGYRQGGPDVTHFGPLGLFEDDSAKPL